jgi:penicillin-binding protein 2
VLSYKNSIRLININAPRGIIYDRNNKIIADNRLGLGIFIVPQELKDFNSEIKKLSEILGVPESLLIRNYRRNYEAPFAPCELLKNASKREAILIEESKLDMPGVLVKEAPLRRYLYGGALAHVMGYIGEIDRCELELLEKYGYSVKDWIGKDGVEKIADVFLRGKDGGMQIQVDNRGRQVRVLNFKKPKKGKDIYLTIDAALQEYIWKMMKEKKGAAIFMDVNNGEILALLSTPSYDPNNSISKVLDDEDAPLLNRAIMGQYPPGSLFKIIIGLAGVESKKARPETTFVCNGKLNIGKDAFHCWNRDGHGHMNLENAIIESCNVYFYNFGILLGSEKILEFAKEFGLGKKTGIELSGEIEGFVPSRLWKRMVEDKRWYTGDTANLSIGQGYLLVTPLQVVRVIAAIANGGALLEPHVLKGRGLASVPIIKIEKKNLDFIRRAMKGVVEKGSGTGFRAWSSIVSISAKTGTSQAGEGLRSHAWFGGFAPSVDPEISFVVFLEHGGSGGDTAAMIAKKAVEYWYKNR